MAFISYLDSLREVVDLHSRTTSVVHIRSIPEHAAKCRRLASSVRTTDGFIPPVSSRFSTIVFNHDRIHLYSGKAKIPECRKTAQ